MQAVQSPMIPLVAELIRQHPGTISLGQGIAYYGPPQEALEQIPEFLSQPSNHQYQPVHGIPSLIEAIEKKLCQEDGYQTGSGRRVVVTAGSNMGFLNAVLAITQPGDEILLQTPYYFNHEMAVTMAGCRAVCVPTDVNYQLQPEQIEAALTERTRGIVTISPNNPTGVVYPPTDLKAVNHLCRERGLYHIHDQAYEYFLYDGIPPFSLVSVPEGNHHTISLFSLSKSYGFAGWRIGYMVIPEALFMPILKIQDTNLICPPVISQYAALGALQVGSAYCRERLESLVAVRQVALSAFQTLGERVQIPTAQGAFYFLLRLKTDWPAMAVVEHLIREHRVAVIPGDTFGLKSGEGICYVRVAYGALDQTRAAEGIGRLVEGLKHLLG
ncbi:pyridoxal phosphate-dependent aminotransferase [Synechococcus sp. Nb3U1]|uniref:pyridoxal phosphate-dependent aminotransferase n=1 Tax=Synechococcus sp. Nb3U1 TaxID=1914529 RepID=UPI001F237676|nr:pyridoxal phosphate-dependent aminotransferase [Synechococcus sp. Nb3U1]MCF2972619.1 pyridoxal phosphate-dependent aminotransferase [Synechococcus sp. Nb3U1]